MHAWKTWKDASIITPDNYDIIVNTQFWTNEVSLTIDGRSVISLLDTGSMVSTISATLSKSMDLTIQPLEHLLSVEGAGGHTLSYLGYVEVTISCLDIDVHNSNHHVGGSRHQVSCSSPSRD